MLRPDRVRARTMSQSPQGPVSWDTEALTSNQLWREQSRGKPDLWLVKLSRTASFCLCVRERRSEWDLSFFSSVVFVPPLVLHGQSLNHRVWEGERIERPGDFLSLHSHSFFVWRWVVQVQLCVCVCVCAPNRLECFWLLYLHCLLCDWSNLYLTSACAYFMYVSMCLRVVKCFLCAHDGIRVTAVADYL